MFTFTRSFIKTMELIIFLGLIILTKSQMMYPDQFEYVKALNYPIYPYDQQQIYQSSYNPVAYAPPVAYAAPAAATPAAATATGTYSQTAYYAPQQQQQPAQTAYYASQQQQPAQSAYYAPQQQQQPAQTAYYASQQQQQQPAQTAYYAPQAAYASPMVYSLESAYPAAPVYSNLNQQQKRVSRNGETSGINANTNTQPISPLAQSLPPDWAYQVNDIISKGVTKLALNIQNVIYANNLLSRTTEKDNIVFSPLNIAGALAIVHLGSAGVTFDETSRILGLATGVDIATHSELVHQIFGLLMSIIHQGVSGSTRTINIANGIFLQEGYPIRPEFKTISENVYKSEVVNLDFLLKGKEAQDRINAWVKDKTNGKIASILNDEPSPSTSVIIASALYFNAEWDRFFINGITKKRSFFIEPNQQITVDFMYNAGDFPFYEDKNIGVKIVGLPYKGLDTTMYIILPTIEGASALGEFEKTLTPEIIEYLIQNMRNQTSIIGIPKMKITSSYRLKKVLQSLGLVSLFEPTLADLSLLSSGKANQNELSSNSEVSANADFNRPIKQIGTTRSSDNRDQLIFSRFGGTLDEGRDNRKNLFHFIDTNRNYNVEQWSTGFNIRRLQKKKREIERKRINVSTNNLNRMKRQTSVPEEFLRIIENRNFRFYGLDNLRNSGALNNPHLYADDVLHKVDIDINEKGTEAGAATAVVLERDGRQKRLIANRPFLFFIRHNPTKLILFWGTINTPTPNYPN
ncbi:PREDICTED: uncharacterized protein LOC107071802 [Polistes dominula]|uniref:Uncharacterized protein LOC107071802 n=1 Tax=Polistes dominula TaxID=743375 RepID=A0ABM1J2B7_POLDO|nr:PREDICTED: uncharacterized protein LOC107071802 [Polistes dominula]